MPGGTGRRHKLRQLSEGWRGGLKPSSAGMSRSHANRQTLTQRGCLSACLTDCWCDSVIHTNANTHTSVSALPDSHLCLFLFFWLPLAPLALPLPPNTNKSIFLRPAGDEPGWWEAFWVWWIGWGEREGCWRMQGRAIRWRLLPAKKVAIEQPHSLRAASGGNCCFFSSAKLLSSNRTFTLLSVHGITQHRRVEHRVTGGYRPQGEGGTDQA